MTVRRVVPGEVRGVAVAPPSKSYTHRALVAAHLAEREYEIVRPLLSDDTRATVRAIERLGSTVRTEGHRWVVRPRSGGAARAVTIDCAQSGTTLRLVAPLAARSGRTVRLTGRGRLPQRPITELFRALGKLGATCRTLRTGRGLPATVRGPLRGGAVALDASQSSQFASALLLTLPTLPEASRIDLIGPIVSAPYIDATLRVLDHHRIQYRHRGRRFALPGGQTYRGRRFAVPGDASSAAYLWTAAAVTSGRVRVTGVPPDWPQADRAVLAVLRAAGARVREDRDGATVEGGTLRPFRADLTHCPDLYPLAGVLAATIPGSSRLTGAPHLVFKESDRRSGTVRIARALGGRVRAERGGLTIRGADRARPLRLLDLDDHRLVMSAAVGALAADGVSTIGDAAAVRKSFPEFWSVLDGLRGTVAP